MKKLIALMLALLTVLALCACGESAPVEISCDDLITLISPAYKYNEKADGYVRGKAEVYFDRYTEGAVESDAEYFSAEEYANALIEEFGVDAEAQTYGDSGAACFTCVNEGYKLIFFVFAKEKADCCEYYTVQCSAPENAYAKYEADFALIADNVKIN